mgnify:CR=1 FL=1
MGQILAELIKFANLIVTMTKAAACANRIQGVLEIPQGEREIAYEKTEQPPAEEDEMVVFSHVGLTYEHAGAERLSRTVPAKRTGFWRTTPTFARSSSFV